MHYQKGQLAAMMSGIVLAGTLVSSALAYAQPVSEYDNVYPVYHDKRSGETFYQLSDQSSSSAIIYADRQGNWSKLSYVSVMQYPYLFFRPYTNSFVFFQSDLPHLYNKRFMYDPSRKAVIDGQTYTMSPNGESGFLQIEHYISVRNTNSEGFTPRRGTTLLMKNRTTGIIRELWTGRGFLQTSYTNDGRLLVSTDSKVYLADSQSFKLKPIASGRLYYYADKTDEAVIIQSDTADLLLYQVSDGTTRTIGPSEPRPKYSNMNTGFPPKSWPVPSPSLEVDSLPVTPISIEYQPEALLTLGGEYEEDISKVAAPLAFIGTNGITYVPLDPFKNKLRLKVKKEITTRDDASPYRFNVSLKQYQLTFDDTNSRIISNRLYVPLSALKQLGMGDVSIEWNPPAVPFDLK
ncbi:hypothetical protein [Paenibacillus xylaniclasticus]|uniref:hypothetical protein n=1 Tax=Paenibacillus xylaniclasticus TaxID=588083 RepID=UPI000FDAF592|nr:MULTISPECIES: hypothetical protein [Paenibacillus]GFN33379.1 hypothetical protein PCURB6_36390 [Paenibacillus curdlanolyticus]